MTTLTLTTITNLSNKLHYDGCEYVVATQLDESEHALYNELVKWQRYYKWNITQHSTTDNELNIVEVLSFAWELTSINPTHYLFADFRIDLEKHIERRIKQDTATYDASLEQYYERVVASRPARKNPYLHIQWLGEFKTFVAQYNNEQYNQFVAIASKTSNKQKHMETLNVQKSRYNELQKRMRQIYKSYQIAVVG